ncbi:MAG: hypothetical protein Q8M40_05220 [Legionella sp.]|nr:hypothetical protein [Legionella sp.]
MPTMEQLNSLVNGYLKTKKTDKISDNTAFMEAVTLFENEFGDLLNLEAIASGNSEFDVERRLFHTYLDKSLSYNQSDNRFSFSKIDAHASICVIRQNLDVRDIRSLYSHSSNLGIREKYLKNILGSQEWLIDLDLERSLESMGLRDKIRITRFNPRDIGMQLHFCWEKHNGSDIYSIPLLLNKGSEGRQSGCHWFAAVITVNSNTNTVSYQVKDSFRLNENQKKEIAQIMEEGIRFSEKSISSEFETAFEAYPNLLIDNQSCHIIGEATQKDSYSCGYRALHALLNDPSLASIVNFNTKAKNYADCTSSSHSLVRYFYQEQLNNLIVDKEMVTHLQRGSDFQPSLGQKDKVQLYPEQVVRYLDQINSSPLKTTSAVEPLSQLNPIVVKKLNEFSILKDIISFPGTDDKELTPEDYDEFLLNTHVKLSENNKVLEKLYIVPCTSISLDGLNFFSANEVDLKIKELVIDIADIPNESVAGFVEKLKTLLINMSEKNLKKLTIIDNNNKINAELWQVIVDLIKAREIKIDILLPEKFSTTNLQREIDQAVSTNSFMSPSLGFPQKHDAGNHHVPNGNKRTRPRQDPAENITVDIELQQEQQAEVAVASQKMSAQGSNSDVGELEVLSAALFSQFYSQLNKGSFKVSRKSYLISESNAQKRWQSWFGHVDKEGREIQSQQLYGITIQACEQLLDHPRQFKMGVDLNHLPQGFAVLEYPAGTGKKVLHYDALSFALQNKRNPVAVVITEPPRPKPLPHPLLVTVMDGLNQGSERDRLIASKWQQLQSNPYDREANYLFAAYLPKLMTYNKEQLEQLFNLTFEQNHINKEQWEIIITQISVIADLFAISMSLDNPYGQRLSELFGSNQKVLEVVALAKSLSKNAPVAQSALLNQLLAEKPGLLNQCHIWCKKLPSVNADALLRTYSQVGEVGLYQLFSHWNDIRLDVLQSTLDTLFTNGESYEPFMDKGYQEALAAVEGFSGAQKIWWDKLLKQHGKAVGYDELPFLVESFKAFSKEIEAKRLNFYKLSADSFQDTESMPVALTRMLTILNNCQTRDLKAQWKNMSRLSLGPTGAIRAIKDGENQDNKCLFVIPEMNATYYSDIKGYKKATDDWHDLGKQTTLSEAKVEFYKGIAHQKYRLPISFYNKALEKIQAKNFEPLIQVKLVALLYSSTTGIKNELFLKNEEEALSDWDNILSVLDKLPLPSIIKSIPNLENKTRRDMVNSLFVLSQVPSLPVLDQLFKLICNSLKLETYNPLKIKAELEGKVDSLNRMCKTLEGLTRKYDGYDVQYGDAIYEGMRFYNKKDFAETAQNSIFHSHLETASKLADYKYNQQSIGVPTELIKLLFRLISTFQIKKDDAAFISEKLSRFENNPAKRKAAEYTLQLLTQMETNVKNTTKLTFQYLNSILFECTDHYAADHSINKSHIENIIKERLEPCFPQGFFKKLQMQEISAQVLGLIDNEFPIMEDKELIIAVLKQFNEPGESSNFYIMVKKIAIIVGPMLPNERRIFLKGLQRKELFHPNPSKNDEKLPLEQFDGLLDAIMTRGYVHDFIYLLAQPESQNSDGLVQKASLYLSTILPDVEKNPSGVVSKMEILPLVTEFLLKSPVEVLNSSHKIHRKDENILTFFKIFISSWLNNGKEINLEALQTAVEYFKQNFSKEFNSIDRLLDQIKLKIKPEVHELPQPKETVSQKNSKGINEAFKSLGNKVRNFFTSKKQTETLKPVPEIESIEVKPPQIFDKEYLNSVLKDITTEELRRTYYPGILQDLFKNIYSVAEQYPGAKDLIIEFFQKYIVNEPNSATLIVSVWDGVMKLQEEFEHLNDSDTVRSLCYHYSGVEGNFTPQKLLELMQHNDYQALTNNKRLILKMVSVLLNNEKYFERDEINKIISLCGDKELGAVFLSKLEEFYNNAPYPSLAQLIQWHETEKNSANYSEALSEKYAQFDRRPCSREIGGALDTKKGNGFELDKAKEKAGQFEGIVFLEADLQDMENECVRARGLSTALLLTEFKKFSKSPRDPELTHVKLVAITAELLYRSKGKDGAIGSSFEINTTQYLAVLGTLNSGSHNTSQIGTGEGKSRIMALCNACQFGLGKTVDFVTSDVQLATRDYLEFQSFYSLLGAHTNIILADTPAAQYCIGGINYSDASNLSLFRNKASSTGLGQDVIDPKAENRSLMLDEADKTYFDVADTRFNYSTEGDESLKGLEWIYPLMIDFFAQDDANKNTEFQDLYYQDIDGCNKAFFKFATSRLESDQVARLRVLPQGQIESWQEAAITARALKFKKHFNINADAVISTPFGPKIASEAQLIADKRGSKHSKFSFGVHQCLHARLNKLKQNPQSEESVDKFLLEKLEGCKTFFHVDAEKQIIYSSTSKSLLDDYSQGGVTAVTGTAGSLIEQQEATSLYSNMKFVSVPRHSGLNREDRPIRLTADEKDYIKALVEYIQEARRNNQPVLVICRDDIASETMQIELSKALQDKEPIGEMQRIDSQLSLKAEAELIKNAGKPGMVTVSTGMVGRGTDIHLQDEAKTHGLKVLLAHLPRERDMMQILGRSGRFGARGDTRIVLNKVELKATLGKTTLNEGFYTAPETYIRQQQALMDRKNQCERLIKNTISDFSKKVTDNFFKEFLVNIEPNQRKELSPAWIKFVKEKDQHWNSVWKQIIKEMDKTNPESELINKHLASHQRKTQELWDDLSREIAEKLHKGPNKSDKNPAKLPHKEVGELKLDNKTTQLINGFDVNKLVRHRVKIYDKYDPAHDGRAVVYSRPFEKLRAFFKGERRLFADFRAWREGHGILFPNLRAFWNGHMSFGQFLFGYSKPDTRIPEENPEEVKNSDVNTESNKNKMFYSSNQLICNSLEVLPANVGKKEVKTDVKPVPKVAEEEKSGENVSEPLKRVPHRWVR